MKVLTYPPKLPNEMSCITEACPGVSVLAVHDTTGSLLTPCHPDTSLSGSTGCHCELSSIYSREAQPEWFNCFSQIVPHSSENCQV